MHAVWVNCPSPNLLQVRSTPQFSGVYNRGVNVLGSMPKAPVSGNVKSGWVMLTVAFLLVNSMGVCASMPVASPPAHPCCPASPATSEHCAGPACVCPTSAPTSTAFLPSTEAAPALMPVENAVAEVSQAAGFERRTVALVLFTPLDRYLTFHQFLI